MRLTKPQVFAGAVLVSWACAKQNAPDPGSYTPNGTGGTSTHPGSGGSSVQHGSGGSAVTTGGSSTASGGTASATGGTAGVATGTGGGSGGMHVTPGTGGSSTSAGRTGTGGTSARAGGPGAGGTTGLGGISSTGGTAGTSAIMGTTGGSMGAAGLPNDPNWKPPDMTATAPLVVFYQTSNAMASSSDIQIMMFLKNQTTAAYDLSNVTIRYWMSSEPPPVFSIYYQSTGLNLSKTIQFIPNMANSYILFSFGKGGSVAPYVDQNSLNSAQVSAGVQGASGINNAMFNQANDWSFDATASMPKANPKITLYDGDTLIWGCEPSHVCAQPPVMTGGEAGASSTGQGGSP